MVCSVRSERLFKRSRIGEFCTISQQRAGVKVSGGAAVARAWRYMVSGVPSRSGEMGAAGPGRWLQASVVGTVGGDTDEGSAPMPDGREIGGFGTAESSGKFQARTLRAGRRPARDQAQPPPIETPWPCRCP